jgi:hypothetical protein
MGSEIATRAKAAKVIAETIANTGVSDPRLIGIAGRVLDALAEAQVILTMECWCAYGMNPECPQHRANPQAATDQ